MCSTWLINGRYCESGADLVEALGLEPAKRVNTYYELVGTTGWVNGLNGERIEHTITESHVLDGCLCHIEHSRMKALTGTDWDYDASLDAFVPRPSPL